MYLTRTSTFASSECFASRYIYIYIVYRGPPHTDTSCYLWHEDSLAWARFARVSMYLLQIHQQHGHWANDEKYSHAKGEKRHTFKVPSYLALLPIPFPIFPLSVCYTRDTLSSFSFIVKICIYFCYFFLISSFCFSIAPSASRLCSTRYLLQVIFIALLSLFFICS